MASPSRWRLEACLTNFDVPFSLGTFELGRHVLDPDFPLYVSRQQAKLSLDNPFASMLGFEGLTLESVNRKPSMPTGVQYGRDRGTGKWHWLSQGQTAIVGDGDRIALDKNLRAGTVLTLHRGSPAASGGPSSAGLRPGPNSNVNPDSTALPPKRQRVDVPTTPSPSAVSAAAPDVVHVLSSSSDDDDDPPIAAPTSAPASAPAPASALAPETMTAPAPALIANEIDARRYCQGTNKNGKRCGVHTEGRLHGGSCPLKCGARRCYQHGGRCVHYP